MELTKLYEMFLKEYAKSDSDWDNVPLSTHIKYIDVKTTETLLRELTQLLHEKYGSEPNSFVIRFYNIGERCIGTLTSNGDVKLTSYTGANGLIAQILVHLLILESEPRLVRTFNVRHF